MLYLLFHLTIKPFLTLQLPGERSLKPFSRPGQTSTWSSYLWVGWAVHVCSVSSTMLSSSCWSNCRVQQTASGIVSASTAVKTQRRSFPSTPVAAVVLKPTHGTRTVTFCQYHLENVFLFIYFFVCVCLFMVWYLNRTNISCSFHFP